MAKKKMIPVKYIHLKPSVLFSFILDPSKIRLSNFERFKIEYYIFIESLKKSEPLVFELIKDSKPVRIDSVKVKFGTGRFEIVYKNNIRAKCPSCFYAYFNKKQIQHSLI